MPSGFTTAAGTKGTGFTTTRNKSQDLTTGKKTTQLNLEELAIEAGIEVPSKKKKLSVLQRVGAGLSSFETGNAVYTGMERGFVAGLGSYFTGVFKGVGSAITGRDFGQTEKKTYKDIVEKAGIENGIAKFGLGFVGDVLLDPTTYFGGAIAKGTVKGTKFAASGALKTIGKVAPKTEQGIRLAGQGLKEALGKGFVYGYGTSKGLAEKSLEISSELSKAKVGIVKSNLKRLGTNTLSDTQQEELAIKLLEGKRTEFLTGRGTATGKQAARTAATSTDPLVQKTIEQQSVRSQKFAQSAGIQDPFEVYFPGIAKDKIKNFFDSTRFLKVGTEGYKKEFKNLLKDDELIRKPAEAFARREFEISKDNIIRSQLNGIVREFGKPLSAFKTQDEALKAGYRLVKEKSAFGKPIGYLLETDKKFIDNLISPEFTTIDAIAKHTGFDALTALFKRSVTGLFAPFHVRNFVSGLVQNYEVLGPKALSPKNIALGQRIALKLAKGKSFGDETLELAGNKYSLNKLVKPFEKRFGSSSQYIADIGDATAEKQITKLKSWNPLSADAIHFRTARAIGNFIETQQKATAYIAALRDGASIKDALKLAAKSGFDYRALTPLESKVFRRIIPFYSFTRKNLELQFKTLGENPQRIAILIKLMRDAGNLSEDEKAGLPDYLQEQFAIKTGTSSEGLPEVASGFGTAVEQPGQILGKNPIRRIAATLNPIFKLPLERAFNKDFFRDRPLSDVIEAGEYAKSPQAIKDFLQVKEVKTKDFKTGKEKIKYQANPHRLQLLRNLPTTRGATYISAIFNETSTPTKVLNSVTGIKPKPIDIETVEYFRDRDRQRELEDLLIRAGVMKRFEKAYVPKNTK